MKQTLIHQSSIGHYHGKLAEFEFSDKYPTGGMQVDVKALGLLNDVSFVILPTSAGGYMVEYDYNNNKILVLVSADGDKSEEVAGDTDLSDITIRALFLGI